MAYENIQINTPNFCVGPQAGTYCSVDNSVYPVVMHVRNELGTLLRTFGFSPFNTFNKGPYVYDDGITINSDGYYNSEFLFIKYVGPRDQTSYFNGAVFYTLERRSQKIRTYYTYELEDPEDPFSPYKTESDGSLVTEVRPEYSSCIIRRWILNESNAVLVLDKTFIKNSDVEDWFDVAAFAVQYSVYPLIDHSAHNSMFIEITTTSGLKKYDTLMLGPSSDVDNLGKIEEVYVHEIVDATTIEVKNYLGYQPPLYDYVAGDYVTIFNDILLFSNARPLINELDIAYGYETPSGTLYNLDQTNYGEVTHRDYSGIYSDIRCAVWNQEFYTLSFAKESNLLHLSLSNYTVSKSQNLALYYPTLFGNIPLYDIDIKGTAVYRLQKEIIKRADDGQYALMNWLTYNLHVDSLAPYTSSVTLMASKNILFIANRSFIKVIVRDQFGIGLINKNVYFTATGDIGAVIAPIDGYLITDSNGTAELQYDAGYFFEGRPIIKAKVDGSNITHGSVFIVGKISLTQYIKYESFLLIPSLPYNTFNCNIFSKKTVQKEYNEVGQVVSEYDGGLSLLPRVDYMYPKNDLGVSGMRWENYNEQATLLIAASEPSLVSAGNSAGIDTHTIIKLPQIKLLFSRPSVQAGNPEEEDYVIYKLLVTGGRNENTYPISQNFVSRHLTHGHMALTSLDQFVFVQEARPSMWSEKNNVDTDYWIRLRPFASSLDPDTLVIKFKEVSYLGEDVWRDVTAFGTITLFDAGGGLLGIDFYYVPSENFHHNAIAYVHIEVYDTALVPNKIILDYWFKLIQDYKAPYIENRFPAVEAYNIPINTNITFDLLDNGEGVDISTLDLLVNNRKINFTYEEYEPGNYHVICILDYEFHYGETVYVVVDVLDRTDNNNRLFDGWYFYCAESEGPWVNMDNTVPKLCLNGVSKKQTVSAQVYGIDDTGIDYDSIKVEVGGRYRDIKITPIVYRLS